LRRQPVSLSDLDYREHAPPSQDQNGNESRKPMTASLHADSWVNEMNAAD
jgi:hypothetical protein